MKILWFTNTPCSAVEKIGIELNSGGWLRSLEEELKKVPEVELAVCFYTSEKYESFNYKGTCFYPVLRKGMNSKLSRFINRILPSPNRDETEVKGLLKVIAQFTPDLIHIHGTEDNFGLIQFHTNIPTVISLQGILSPYSEKYFAGIPFQNALDNEGLFPKLLASGLRKSYSQFQKNTLREQRILADAKYIIGRTDWDKRVTTVLAPFSNYFVADEMLRPTFYEKKWENNQFGDTLKIVTISGDVLYKGFETILSSAQILKSKTNLKFEWRVIGLNKSSNIVKMVLKWKRLKLANFDIKLLGSKNENEIAEILLDSDIYCQTSHIENSANSLCEAMIVGLPIIATFAGGTSSLLKDKEDGILIQEGDSFSLAGAIKELSANFLQAKQYGESARNKAVQRNERIKIREEYLNIYSKVLGSSLKNSKI